tara:strand:- start:4 stop:903 length:900 start_codon:yes stop_codon:yes gene_type:complete
MGSIDGFMFELRQLMTKKTDSSIKKTDTRNIKKFFNEEVNTFNNFEQHDSHECLIYMLSIIHEYFKKEANDEKRPVGMEPTDGDHLLSASPTMVLEHVASIEWLRSVKDDGSVVIDLFTGQLRQMITCERCLKVTNKFEIFNHLSVPIEGSNLFDCINKFCENEKLSGEDRRFCDKCKEKTEYTKNITLWKLPNILIFHLNRYNLFCGRGYEKRQIIFPIDNLTLRDQSTGSLKMYQLVCTVNHVGQDPVSGHYISYIRKGFENNWYCIDDDSITAIKFEDIINSNSYLLFYVCMNTSI